MTYKPLKCYGLSNMRYSLFKDRYQKKWQACLPQRSQSLFAECNDCYELKQAIKAEKVAESE